MTMLIRLDTLKLRLKGFKVPIRNRRGRRECLGRLVPARLPSFTRLPGFMVNDRTRDGIPRIAMAGPGDPPEKCITRSQYRYLKEVFERRSRYLSSTELTQALGIPQTSAAYWQRKNALPPGELIPHFRFALWPRDSVDRIRANIAARDTEREERLRAREAVKLELRQAKRKAKEAGGEGRGKGREKRPPRKPGSNAGSGRLLEEERRKRERNRRRNEKAPEAREIPRARNVKLWVYEGRKFLHLAGLCAFAGVEDPAEIMDKVTVIYKEKGEEK